MVVEEGTDEVGVADSGRVEHDSHHLVVAGFSGAHLGVRGVWCEAGRVPHLVTV